jgi:hypothetical protein
MTIPTTLDAIQYIARPLGKVVVKNPNISGIIHNIIRFVDSCLGSTAGIMVIFCIAHIDTPTRMGKSSGLGTARSRPRKFLSMGIAPLTVGSHE